MHTFLAFAIAAEALVILVVGIGWTRARRARRTADACDFPGCAEARAELRALADRYDQIPREDVIAVVEGVERKESSPHDRRD